MRAKFFFKACPFPSLVNKTQKASTSCARVSVRLNEEVSRVVEEGSLKPRFHPGIVKTPTVQLPPEIKKAIKIVIGDTPMRQLMNESAPFSRWLRARHPPMEDHEMLKKRSEITQEVESKMKKKEVMSEEELHHYNQVLKSRINTIVKQRVYNWQPIEFTRHLSLLYLITRGAPEYAVLLRVFQHIMAEDQHFEPTSLFDFGSGIGTVTWAANHFWKNSVKEFFCVDSSANMNDLNRKIIELVYKDVVEKVFYRQFLPISRDRNYDLVISAFSLLELPSSQTRIQTILSLWKKTSKYLVLVEPGTIAGFKMLSEARNFLNTLPGEECHIVAPCPHELDCPRIKSDRTPCNFDVSYFAYPKNEIVKKELFSFMVFKRGKREGSSPQWPRIVRPVLCRSRHVICRVCTKNGSLNEIIITPTKHGKSLYRCAKASKWGDMLPVVLET